MELMYICNKPVLLDSFRISNSVLYIIKSISKDSENDIVAYFYSMGITLFTDAVERKKIPLRCNRVVKIFYKDTGIYVKLDVWSNYLQSKFCKTVGIHMSVSHVVSDWRYINKDSMDTMLSETALGLSNEPVLEARKPKLKLYKCLEEKKPRSSVNKEKNINWSALPEELKTKFET